MKSKSKTKIKHTVASNSMHVRALKNSKLNLNLDYRFFQLINLICIEMSNLFYCTRASWRWLMSPTSWEDIFKSTEKAQNWGNFKTTPTHVSVKSLVCKTIWYKCSVCKTIWLIDDTKPCLLQVWKVGRIKNLFN